MYKIVSMLGNRNIPSINQNTTENKNDVSYQEFTVIVPIVVCAIIIRLPNLSL